MGLGRVLGRVLVPSRSRNNGEEARMLSGKLWACLRCELAERASKGPEGAPGHFRAGAQDCIVQGQGSPRRTLEGLLVSRKKDKAIEIEVGSFGCEDGV